MKKILIIAFLLLILITLTACNIKGNNTENPSEDNDAPYVNNDVTFDIGETVYIVTGKGSDTKTLDIGRVIGSAIGETCVSLATDDKPVQANEITVGVCNRQVSTVGYKKLEDVARDSEATVRYGIYSLGNSVAIVYDNSFGFEEQIVACAISFFEEMYVKENSPINIGAGEFRYSTVDISTLQEKTYSDEWQSLEELVGTETAEALKQMYSELYTDELIGWLASLYDSNYGGFYYSASAKDGLKINYNGADYYLLPDIESTAKAVDFIEKSGMIYGYSGVKDAIPKWMSDQIIKFVKEKQKEDGYFYHPQWSLLEVGISRRGYDLLNATNLLSSLGAAPTYDTPSGVGGAEALIHLSDKESFLGYLEALNVRADSYLVGIELSAQLSEIIARDEVLKSEGADYSLAKLLIAYLNDSCYSSNGLWESSVTVNAVSGLAVISSIYGELGAALPYHERAAESVISAICDMDESTTSLGICNAWGAIRNVVYNAENCLSESTGAEAVAKIREALVKDGAALIEATTGVLCTLMNGDSSFQSSSEGSDEERMGMPVASQGIKEGNLISAVSCSTEILEYIFGAFGSSVIPAYTRADLVRFTSLVTENRVVYNYTSSEVFNQPGSVNYRVYNYKNSEGKAAPMIYIYNSKDYTDEKLQRAILTHIITSESGASVGLGIDDLEFLLSVVFGGKFTYHYASSESNLVDNLINYKITPYTSKDTVIRIYNSYKITNEADMREILTYLITSEEGARAGLSLKNLDYYIIEWKAHNIMYVKPSIIPIMSAEEVKKRAKHVDLNSDDGYASMYLSIVSMYG